MPVEGSARIWKAPDHILLKSREAVPSTGRTLLRVDQGALSVYACSRRGSGHTTRRFLWSARAGDTAVWCGGISDKKKTDYGTALELISDQDTAVTVVPASALTSTATGVWLNRLATALQLQAPTRAQAL